MKYSTTKISPAKMNSSTSKSLVKSPKLRKSQQKAEEVCQRYFTQLRSGLIIEKTACYFRKEITKRHSPRTAGKYKERHLVFTACHQQLKEDFACDVPMVQKRTRETNVPSIQGLTEYSASLSTYNDQSITFVFEDGSYEIYVEDLGKDQEKDKVLFRYYDSKSPSHETGDGVDGQTLLVNLSPTKNKDFLLHANNKEHSVELQKCENQLPDQVFFRLHMKSPKCVSFECKNNPGVFIGVKDNHLALIKVGDQTEHSSVENTIFKLS
ncbi:interleukin-33 isoform X1 [Ursus americanus]|uniref:Interleukin-33 n=1 Tax=Ursus maritimus TaxID=29073 RepID=A0A384C104_URSMA|nr:interleukin-33 isoform X1 [Ursus maritimus]XP_008688089.1 interleukin-33 isoform X1 [Ursus maritimus]XP_008688090.1 interleukin-33 isoform X1 [Ursus maritimus]XP_026362336.1 interleukin-33 isoform X1 [Ursus arctos]XP_045636463.1 interleukin-33 isoform X1 [Ursus americanus]XP_045636465.1 interleukin-33 isoform X1 [Ursus americanus]XP_057169401.1 interleukin-33 isoform X1 [Ursus arctos]XP_057169402.1 interleukin-33 isoform X1 [Ursus arctos]XP_057169404.1 interleukin-33 isoform X1 [Ursus ar